MNEYNITIKQPTGEILQNKIIVNVDMPDVVFQAWKEYAEQEADNA